MIAPLSLNPSLEIVKTFIAGRGPAQLGLVACPELAGCGSKILGQQSR